MRIAFVLVLQLVSASLAISAFAQNVVEYQHPKISEPQSVSSALMWFRVTPLTDETKRLEIFRESTLVGSSSIRLKYKLGNVTYYHSVLEDPSEPRVQLREFRHGTRLIRGAVLLSHPVAGTRYIESAMPVARATSSSDPDAQIEYQNAQAERVNPGESESLFFRVTRLDEVTRFVEIIQDGREPFHLTTLASARVEFVREFDGETHYRSVSTSAMDPVLELTELKNGSEMIRGTIDFRHPIIGRVTLSSEAPVPQSKGVGEGSCSAALL